MSYKYCNWQISGIARQTLFMMFVYNCEFSPPSLPMLSEHLLCEKNFVRLRKNCPDARISRIGKCICPNCQISLSKLSSVLVQIVKCICSNCQMYLLKLPNAFVHIEQKKSKGLPLLLFTLSIKWCFFLHFLDTRIQNDFLEEKNENGKHWCLIWPQKCKWAPCAIHVITSAFGCARPYLS